MKKESDSANGLSEVPRSTFTSGEADDAAPISGPGVGNVSCGSLSRGAGGSEIADGDEDAEKGLSAEPEKEANMCEAAVECRVYPDRWWILAAVVLLNTSNYAHWIAFPSVAKTVAKYYDRTGDDVDLIPTVSYGLGVPCSVLGTYVAERYGLKHVIHIGAFLTGIGGLLCFLSSLHTVFDLPNDMPFYLALIGQALTGIGCPFVAIVPTKISHHWFADDQRAIATMLLGMSGTIGCIFGQGLTPLFVREPNDVLLLNLVWFVPAAIGALLTAWKVRRSYPPLPPTQSAAIKPKARNVSDWIFSIKTIFSNPAYIIMLLFLGGCMGCVSSIVTKMEQILCSKGYTDQLSGLAGSLILLCATVTSVPIGIVAHRTGKATLISKSFIFVGLLAVISSAYFMRLSNQAPGIIASCVIMGAFAVGAYALSLELVVECTYPVSQATSTAFVFLSSSLQGVFLMGMENVLNSDLSPEEWELQTCVDLGDSNHQQPRDYSSYLNFLAIYIWVLYLVFAIFFRTKLKRTIADRPGYELDEKGSDNRQHLSVNENGKAELPLKDESTSIALLSEERTRFPRSADSG